MIQPGKPTLYAKTRFGSRAFKHLELVDAGEESFVYQADTDRGRLYVETVPYPDMIDLAAALAAAYEEEHNAGDA